MEFYEVIEKRRTIRDFENEMIPTNITPVVKQKHIEVKERIHWDRW